MTATDMYWLTPLTFFGIVAAWFLGVALHQIHSHMVARARADIGRWMDGEHAAA